MKTWKLWLGVGLVFVLGVAVGVAGGRAWQARHVLGNLERGPGGIEERFLTHLDEAVKLSQAQKDSIKPLFRALGEKIKAAHDETRPRLDAAIKETNASVRALLDVGQQQRYDEFITRMEKFRAKMGPGGPPPPPPPGFPGGGPPLPPPPPGK